MRGLEGRWWFLVLESMRAGDKPQIWWIRFDRREPQRNLYSHSKETDRKYLPKEGMDPALLLQVGFGHLLCSPYFLYEISHFTKEMCWSRLKQDCNFSPPVSKFEKNHIRFLLWTYFENLRVSSQCRKNTVFREGYSLHDPSLCPSFLASRVFWRECRCLRKTEAKLCIPAPEIPAQAIWGWEHLSSLPPKHNIVRLGSHKQEQIPALFLTQVAMYSSSLSGTYFQS